MRSQAFLRFGWSSTRNRDMSFYELCSSGLTADVLLSSSNQPPVEL